MLGQTHSFCSTSLPLTSTRWVQSTIKLFTVHTLTSVLSINLGSIKNYVILRIKPGATGREARKLSTVLCGPPPTPGKTILCLPIRKKLMATNRFPQNRESSRKARQPVQSSTWLLFAHLFLAHRGLISAGNFPNLHRTHEIDS